MRALALALALLAVACGGHSEAQPLDCWSDGVIDTAEGPRLVVACTRPVEAPPECEPAGEARWHCNILHASAADCAAFPGLCPE